MALMISLEWVLSILNHSETLLMPKAIGKVVVFKIIGIGQDYKILLQKEHYVKLDVLAKLVKETISILEVKSIIFMNVT